MYHIYILRSNKDQSIYIDYANDIEERLKEHNSGLVKATCDRTPWSLVYSKSSKSLERKLRKNRFVYFTKPLERIKNRIKKHLRVDMIRGMILPNISFVKAIRAKLASH
jgi:putative endonuclease